MDKNFRSLTFLLLGNTRWPVPFDSKVTASVNLRVWRLIKFPRWWWWWCARVCL